MWDQRYNDETYAYGTDPNIFLASMHNKLPTGKILCLAEGEFHNGTGAVVQALATKP